MPVIIPAAIAGGQTLLGLGQTIAANRKKKKAMDFYNANPYQVPQSQVRATNIAASEARSTQLPGQELIQEQIASDTAQGVSAARATATSPSQVLQQTVNSYLAQQEANQTLDLNAAKNYEVKQQGYQRALTSLAPYETAKWNYSVLFPTQARLNESSTQGSAGTSNIGQGISSGVSMYANSQYLDKLKTEQQQKSFGLGDYQDPTLSLENNQWTTNPSLFG